MSFPCCVIKLGEFSIDEGWLAEVSVVGHIGDVEGVARRTFAALDLWRGGVKEMHRSSEL